MVDSEPKELLDQNDWSPEALTAPAHITISADDSERTVELPQGFVELLREQDECTADVIGDLLLLSSTQRIYETVTYSENDPGPEFDHINDRLQELFEAEFGAPFERVVGAEDAPHHHH